MLLYIFDNRFLLQTPELDNVNIFMMKKRYMLACMALLLCSICEVAAQVMQRDTFLTDTGRKVVITHIKHGSLAISFEGMEIQVDPVENFPPRTDYSRMPKAGCILVTHEHSDHLDSNAIHALSNESTLLIANENSVKRLGRGCAMRNGEIRKLSDVVSVEAVPAYNTSTEKQKYHPKGRDNGYILDIDGLRIYIAGDTEPLPEMSRITDIDVAFLPVNLPYTMTPEQAAAAARSFMPKVLYPYHYGETKIEQVAEALDGSGIEVRIRNYK